MILTVIQFVRIARPAGPLIVKNQRGTVLATYAELPKMPSAASGGDMMSDQIPLVRRQPPSGKYRNDVECCVHD